jgi:uncharacterized protein YqhQ
MLARMSESPAKPYIGGQAVIEGVMMRSPSSFAVAVRRPDGKIAVREEKWQPIWGRWKFLRWPFLRGALVMVESVFNGYSALKFSAEQATPEEERGKSGGSSFTMTLSILVAVGLFVGLPHQIAAWLGLSPRGMTFHLVAGAAKLTLLLGYMIAIARLPEIRRVFQFHGAEHKSIYTYEKGLTLTVDNAREQTRFHPRCGTTFLVVLVAMSILVFAAAFQLVPVVSTTTAVQRVFEILCKLPLLVPIAGLAYEFQRWSARHGDRTIVRGLMLPGVAVQNITTREPSDDQLEVALAALRVALWRENAGLGAPEKASEPQVFDSLADLERAIASWGEGSLPAAA